MLDGVVGMNIKLSHFVRMLYSKSNNIPTTIDLKIAISPNVKAEEFLSPILDRIFYKLGQSTNP